MENTPNIGLKRWEGGDRILHSEFNDNWDKLDAALLSKLGAAELIGECVNESRSDRIGVDLSTLDWSRYTFVLAELTVRPSRKDALLYFLADIPGNKQYTEAYPASVPGPRTMLISPLRDAAAPARVLTFPGGDLTVADAACNAIREIYAFSNATGGFEAGARLRVLGLR